MKYDKYAYYSEELKKDIIKFDKAVKEKKKRDIQQAARPLLGKERYHLAYYELHYLNKKAADEFRTQYVTVAATQDLDCYSSCNIWKSIAETKVKLELLPPYSAVIKLSFALAKPYLSRDENLFYIIDNPVRREKVFGKPYVAAGSWKGSLRSALRCSDSEKYTDEGEIIRRLFGNERGVEEQEKVQAGRLYFYPTFFKKTGMEVINPHDRASRAGRQPIYFESVPEGAQGNFTLLYVPFDRTGLKGEKEERETKEQVGQDLQAIALGLQAMFTLYGFGAKTSSGYGLARDEDLGGCLKLKVASGPKIGWPSQYLAYSFNTFEELRNCVRNIITALKKEGKDDARQP